MKEILKILLLILAIFESGACIAQEPVDLKIRLTGPVLYDEMHFRLIEGGTYGFDSDYDAYKLETQSKVKPSLYSTIDSGYKLSVNSYPLVFKEYTISLNTIFRTAGSHQFTFTIFSGLPDNYNVLLYDHLVDSAYIIESESTVEFNVSSQELNFEHERFSMIMYPEIVLAGTTNTFCADTSTGKAELRVFNTDEWTYSLYRDTLEILMGFVLGDSLTLTDLSPGQYRIHIGQGVTDRYVMFDIYHQNQFKAGIIVSQTGNILTASNTASADYNYWISSDGYTYNGAVFNHQFDSGAYHITLLSHRGWCVDSASYDFIISERIATTDTSDIITSALSYQATSDISISSFGRFIRLVNPADTGIKVRINKLDLSGRLLLTTEVSIDPNSEELYEPSNSVGISILQFYYSDRFKNMKYFSPDPI